MGNPAARVPRLYLSVISSAGNLEFVAIYFFYTSLAVIKVDDVQYRNLRCTSSLLTHSPLVPGVQSC